MPTRRSLVKVNGTSVLVKFAEHGGRLGHRFRISAQGYKPLVVYATASGRYVCTWRRHWQKVLAARSVGACHPLNFVAATDPAVAFARGVCKFWEGVGHHKTYAKVRDTSMTRKQDLLSACTEGSVARW